MGSFPDNRESKKQSLQEDAGEVVGSGSKARSSRIAQSREIGQGGRWQSSTSIMHQGQEKHGVVTGDQVNGRELNTCPIQERR